MKVKDFISPIFALLFGGLLTFSSCKNDNGGINQPAAAFQKGEVVSITTAPLGSNGAKPRRVHIGSETSGEAQLVWTEGDQLRVMVQEDAAFPFSDFNLTAGENTKTGTFTGTMPADGTEFFLAYPCGNVTVSAWNESTQTIKFQQVNVPNVQDFTYRATSFNTGIMPVVGYGSADTDGNLMGSTTIVGGALRVKLTNNTGAAITFNKIQLYVHNARVSKDAAETSVWGTYTVDYNVSSKAITPSGTTASNSSIVLKLSDKVTLANNETSDDFYFVMLAPLYFQTVSESSFTVYLYDYDGEVSATSDLNSVPSVAQTSFNYNIAVEPGDIVQGTLQMTTSPE